MATPVAQTQAPKGISLVSFFAEFTTVTQFLLTAATRLFSTRSMPSLYAERYRSAWYLVVMVMASLSWKLMPTGSGLWYSSP